MCNGCCGGPLIGGTGFVTTVKYDGVTGNVVWWIDSGLRNNVSTIHDGYLYELSAPNFGGGNAILRQIDLSTAAELQRRDFGSWYLPQSMVSKGGNLYTCFTNQRVDKIDVSDLSSDWTWSHSSAAVSMIEGDAVIANYFGSPNVYRLYTTGTTHVWSVNRDAPDPGKANIFRWIGNSGGWVAVGTVATTGNYVLWRYDGSGSLVDSYGAGAGLRTCRTAFFDGTDIWIDHGHTTPAEAIVQVDSSLSDNFSAVSVGPNAAPTDTHPTKVGSAVYFYGDRYVMRMAGSSYSERHDRGGASGLADVLVRGDEDVFHMLDNNGGTWRLRAFDDSSAPASVDWSINTLTPSVSFPIQVDHHIAYDASDNVYHSGVRQTDSTLIKTSS